MGDVKRSGKTFEERKAASIARKKAEAERRAGLIAKIEASKTPEQKSIMRCTALELMAMLGMVEARQFPYNIAPSKAGKVKVIGE